MPTDHLSPVQPSTLQAAHTTRAGAAFAALHLATWLAAIAQLAIDNSYDNLLCTIFVLSSASATFGYVRVTRAVREVPLSTFSVLGLCITTQWGALVGQSLLGDSLTANLRVPLQTFGYLLGFQMVAISAHWVSRRFSAFLNARRLISDALIAPLGVFRVPAPAALWAMGAIGMLAVIVGKALELGLLGKIADGFGFLAWAPFCIPVLAMRHGASYCNLRRHLSFLALFAVAVVVLGVALNARSFMLLGVLSAVLLFLLFLLDDERPAAFRHLRYAVLAVIVGALLSEPISYFFTAVQVAREQRGKLSKVEMIGHTFQVLQDPAAVRRERDRLRVDAEIGAYDDYYFGIPMLGRLVETKFHDNSFYMVQGVSPLESRLVAEDAVDRVISILPFPVLKAMGMERSKFVTMYSAGDLLTYLRLGLELGAFLTGSMFAQGIAIFGPWTPALYFVLCVAVYVLWDALARRLPGGQPAFVSVMGMLQIYHLFAYGIVSESIGTIVGTLLRFQLQSVLIFALVFAATRAIWPCFKPGALLTGASHAQAPSAEQSLRQAAA